MELSKEGMDHVEDFCPTTMMIMTRIHQRKAKKEMAKKEVAGTPASVCMDGIPTMRCETSRKSHT
jgi:hypothetical protein